MNLEESVYPRHDLDYTNPFLTVIKNAIILYGVDMMSTRRIESYFGSFYVDIEFINDSHCKLTFKNQEEVIKALICNAVFSEKEFLKDEGKKPEELEKRWYELNPYFELCFERKLSARFATNLDVREGDEQNKKKFFYDYQQGKT